MSKDKPYFDMRMSEGRDDFDKTKAESLAMAKAEARKFINSLDSSFVIVSTETAQAEEGTYVDVSMMEGIVGSMIDIVGIYLALKDAPQRMLTNLAQHMQEDHMELLMKKIGEAERTARRARPQDFTK